MNRRALLLSLALALSPAMAQTADEDLHYNDLFASRTFLSTDNREITLSQLRGKVVVFDFWKTWCKPCMRSFRTLDKLKKKYSDNFEVVALNPQKGDSEEAVREFAERSQYGFIFGFDGGLFDELNATGIPYKVFFDPHSKYISSSLGFSPFEYWRVKKIINKHGLSD